MKITLKKLWLAAVVLLFGNLGFTKDLYVSLTGSDAVTYQNNSITAPWATPHKAWAEARAGDTVYFRQGTWELETVVNTKYIGVNGTAENPIIFTSYPGEIATLQWLDRLVFKNGDGAGGLIWIWKEYNHIDRINFTVRYLDNEPTKFGGAPIQVLTPHLKISNCTITVLRHLQTDNSALIHCDTRSHYIEIYNNKLIGPGLANMGSAGVAGPYFVRTRGTKVHNNEISGLLYGIFQKHSNEVDNVPVEDHNHWYDNYIHDCEIAINGRPNWTRIINNILCGISFSSGGNGGDGYAAGDFNIIRNNTIIQPTGIELLRLDLSDYPLTSTDPTLVDPYSGCMHNVIENNVLLGKELRFNPYGPPRPNDGGAPIANYDYHNHTDFNLYSVDNPSQVIVEDRTWYTLPQWRNRILAVHGRVVDQASIVESPIFVGGGSPNTLAGYRLTDASPGKNAGSDGRDMGADVSRVGIQPLTSLTITSPNGSEAWQRRESRPITWTSNGITGNVVIELVQNGTAVGIIAENVAATAGTFTWNVSRLANGTVTTGTGCKIRIRATSGQLLGEAHLGGK